MAHIFVNNTGAALFHHSKDLVPKVDDHHMHAHDSYEILYIISGKGTYLVESTVYTLQPGCVLLMRPGEVHKLQIDPASPYERIALHFAHNLAEQYPGYEKLLYAFNQRPLGAGNMFMSEEYDSRYLYQCLMHIEEADGNPFYGLFIHTTMPTILSELYQGFCRRQKTNPAKGEPLVQTRLQEILGYINEHINEPLSLDDLCQQFYISKTQLGRLFRNATGSTVWDYILVKRLIEARRLILAGMPTTHAAQSCGFRDYSAFYRAYLKRYGSSPAKDRRTYTFDYK